MIVPMKKIFMVVQDKDRLSALEMLRDVGSVHVHLATTPSMEVLAKPQEDLQRLHRVVEALKALNREVTQKACPNWRQQLLQVDQALTTIKTCQEQVEKRQQHIQQWEPWGDFDVKDIEALKEKGIEVRLCEVPVDRRHEWPKDAVVQEISVATGKVRCVVITQGDVSLPFEGLTLPSEGLSDLRLAQEADEIEIREANKFVHGCAHYLEVWEGALIEQEDAVRFEKVRLSVPQQEGLMVLEGYCPVTACASLKEKAKIAAWGLLIQDIPADEEQAPTLLQNPKWVDLVKPLFTMINIVPGYRELDVSAVFLLFFALFVGMLVGDAGYGALIAFGFGIAHFKLKDKIKNHTLFHLIYLLCACTVMWGVLTGTYFGQYWLSGRVPAMLPWLSDNINLQGLCFLIGAIHLSIAHAWRAAVKAPSMAFLGEVGWLFIVWGMFYLAKTLVLSVPFPSVARLFFFGGIALVILFTKPNRNPLKAIGAGVGDLLLNIINSFTDVVSYIRLFAVGMATVAVADAANEMSVFWVIFLHALNILLAAMAILVHGLRLNVLEFSGHLSMAWAGFPYKPFSKTKR